MGPCMDSERVESKPATRRQTPIEEIANSITHGMGAVAAVAGLAVLVVFAAMHGDPWKVAAFSIYGATLVLLYLASTLYHGIQAPAAKRVFHIFDYCGIYLLIAGTYTPFTLVNLRGAWGWAVFGVVWGAALFGIVFQTFFLGRYRVATVAAYVAMGWVIVVALKPTLAAVNTVGIALLLAGGLSYTCGIAFYAWRRLPFHHAVWHLFVLAGSAFHFLAMFFSVLPA